MKSGFAQQIKQKSLVTSNLTLQFDVQYLSNIWNIYRNQDIWKDLRVNVNSMRKALK